MDVILNTSVAHNQSDRSTFDAKFEKPLGLAGKHIFDKMTMQTRSIT